MDRDKPKTTQQDKQRTTSLLQILTRRSTKVEPQQQQLEQEVPLGRRVNDPGTVSVSAHSSPVNQFRNLRRHSSTQNISTISTSPPPTNNNSPTLVNTRKKNGSANRQHNNNNSTNHQQNRFSHQFSLCCSVDDRSTAPTPPPQPVSVRYNSITPSNDLLPPQMTTTTVPKSPTVVHQQNGITIASVHKSPPDTVRSIAANSTDSNQTETAVGATSSSPVKEPIRPPVFNEYQKGTNHQSIAMSACRSRLRQKLLPPPGQLTAADFGVEPHFSSPNITVSGDVVDDDDDNDINNIARVSAAGETHSSADDNNGRSLSYDILTGVRRPTSADSLAKQSLIAAQLLNLIPAERVRERNFVAGRLAVNSLFGAVELDKVLPSRDIKIFVGTWNMNGQNPPKMMTEFVLPHCIDFVPDIVVVGTQESCSDRFEWEVSLQETLGPTHLLLHSTNLGTLHLAVFIRRDLIWFCSVPEDASLSVRPGTAFRTKGAVAISFCLFGTSMLFVTSHLTAHQQKVKERVQDVKRIIHALDLPRNLNIHNKNKDVTQNFDNVFWCGDLNFRLGEPREKVLEWIESTKFPLPSHLPNGYLHTDQLKSVLSNGAAFKDFKEANITFPPTYKYDPGTQNFDTSSKQRAPAYTDRILFKCKSFPPGLRRGSNLAYLLHPNQLECLAYDSVPTIMTSDHKPVWALFRCPVRPGLDSVPLAAGLFNRDVYLEGMKRRLNNAEVNKSHS